MFKNFYKLVIIFIISISYTTFAQYNGGDGSIGNPYQIATPAQLKTLMTTTADWNSHFVLTADLDMYGETCSPIGTSAITFKGSFNGQNHSITNLVINNPSSEYQGLFGYAETTYFIKNLQVSGTVTGANFTGILCACFDGNNHGSIENCSTSGVVNAYGLHAGGLIGEFIEATMNNCHSSGTLNGNNKNEIGGFVGYLSNSTVNGCSSSVDLSGGGQRCGGFAGLVGGSKISECYSSGSVSGSDYIGGFVGSISPSCTIQNCYSTGNVNGSYHIGGFCGSIYNSAIEYCYSIGRITATGTRKGGFIGNQTSTNTYTCNYWNYETAGGTYEDIGGDPSSDDPNIYELNNLQFSKQSIFESCGFDFENTWVMGYNVLDSEYYFPVLRDFDWIIIPTLSEWAVIIFIGLLAGVGGWFVWRKMV